MAPLHGFQGDIAVGVDFAKPLIESLTTCRRESRHEIRNTDAQQLLCRLRRNLRVDLGRDAGVSPS
jgi:hypothetical protein